MLPRISVVTSSYNQGKFIGRTIESVLAQDYPNIEHIVVDGMSSDETPDVLARYSHLKVIREPDSGQSEAINKGFRIATGDIFCFLNSDDTFMPGALHRVAREIAPSQGRHVVMGRCAYIDEDDVLNRIEHPSAYFNHERVLKVWHGHCIPQPATFWTREVWQECGPLDENEHLVLDYDLMCRISRRYHFHQIDQVLAAYRLHASSKSCSNAEEKVRETAILASRRYWGPPWKLRYWRLLCSLTLHRLEQRFGRRRKAADYTGLGVHAWKQGAWKHALSFLGRALLLAPGVVLGRFFFFRPALTWQSPGLPDRTSAWRSFTGQHTDGCVGPQYATTIHLKRNSDWVHIEGTPIFGIMPRPQVLTVTLDGKPVFLQRLTTAEPFSLAVPVEGLPPGPHRLELSASYFLLPHDLHGNRDYRPLVFRQLGVRVSSASCEADAWSKAA